MKYVNFTRCAFLLAVVGATLGGCASGNKNWNYDGSQAVPLVDTAGFLPIQERDEETGALLPYEAVPNPYAELSGRIDKEAVTAYIDARRAFNADKFDFADQLLAELVEQKTGLSGPWVMRGDIALQQEDLARAVEHYIQALEVNPINFNAYLRLAKVQRMRGHFHHAQNTYARALKRWKDGPELHLNLGILYDVYLNMPLKAQAHMEAYQLLSSGNNGDVLAWLEEIRQRTGVASTLQVIGPDGEPEPLSRVSQSEQPTPTQAAAESLSAQELTVSQTGEE